MVQHNAPYNAYPTPPPPGISTSSSSLAGALGAPTSAPEKKYHPNESKAFFNDFLSNASKELPPQPRSVGVRSPPSTPPIPQSSPDPLRLGNASPLTPLSSATVTPKKRKIVEVLIETPSKRSHSTESPFPALNLQRKDSVTSFKSNAVPQLPKLEVYVEVTPPPKSWSTPSTKGKGRQMVPSSDDLDGYGSEDEDEYMKRKEAVSMSNGARSSGKRTGDRDGRGASKHKCLGILFY